MKVRYYGHMGSSGYGRAARANCRALLAAGVELEIRPLQPNAHGVVYKCDDEVLRPLLRGDTLLDPTPDVIIVHDLPVDCGLATVATRGPYAGLFDSGVPVIAYTTWEALTAVPAVTTPLREFEEVWVPSSANQTAFNPISFSSSVMGNKLVRILPHAFDEDELEGRRGGGPVHDPTFRFYYIGAWNSRKNPAGLLRAWANAFGPTDKVELVLHSPGASPDSIASAVGMTGLVPEQMAKISPSISHVSDFEIQLMHRMFDCFVTASRGEAWNLPAFDAMLAGRRVITTGGLGSDDFLHETNAEMIPFTRAPANVDVRVMRGGDGAFDFERIGAQGLSARDIWHDPNILSLANSMRGIARTRARDLEVRYSPAERYGYKAVGKMALGYLEELLNRR
jgi:glycosyltransferase involved in cell wall biosynthesis